MHAQSQGQSGARKLSLVFMAFFANATEAEVFDATAERRGRLRARVDVCTPQAAGTLDDGEPRQPPQARAAARGRQQPLSAHIGAAKANARWHSRNKDA